MSEKALEELLTRLEDAHQQDYLLLKWRVGEICTDLAPGGKYHEALKAQKVLAEGWVNPVMGFEDTVFVFLTPNEAVTQAVAIIDREEP